MSRKVGYKQPPEGWKKGQSGNPAGLVKGVPKLAHALQRLMKSEPGRTRRRVGDPYKPKTILDELVIETYRIAMTARDQRVRLQAIEMLMDRFAGRPVQAVAIEAETTRRIVVELGLSTTNGSENGTDNYPKALDGNGAAVALLAE